MSNSKISNRKATYSGIYAMSTNNPVFKIPSKNPSKFPKVDLASVGSKKTTTEESLEPKGDLLNEPRLDGGSPNGNSLNRSSLKIQTGRESGQMDNSKMEEKQQKIQKKQRQRQQGERKSKIQRNGSRKMNWSARVQLQQQQQLSLSTRIDDNSTLYELVDDLCKVTTANSRLKDDIWDQMHVLSDRIANLEKKNQKAIEEEKKNEDNKRNHSDMPISFDSLIRTHRQTAMNDSDFRRQEQFMEDMKVMPSAFSYGDEYEKLRQRGIIPIDKNAGSSRGATSLLYKSLKSLVSPDKPSNGNEEGDLEDDSANSEDCQTRREIEYLKLALKDRLKYNEALLGTIGEYEDQLLEIMECMAQKHVALNGDEISAIREYSEQVSELEMQMYREYRAYTGIENQSVKLYDGVDRIADYIAGINLNKR